jgi:hypothetical protein
MKINITPKYLIVFLFLFIISCSVKNSTLKKGAEMEKLGNFKQASELYLGVLYRKPNLPEIENALRRSAQLHISETAFTIATKKEAQKADLLQLVGKSTIKRVVFNTIPNLNNKRHPLEWFQLKEVHLPWVELKMT